MFNALLLTVLTALAVGESQLVKVDDRTEVKITLKQDGIQANWDCAGSNMKYVSEHYKTNKFRWDFYKGDAARDIRLPAKGAVRVSSPVDLPELAVKFSVHLEVVDQEDRPVRISAEIPVENPWVEF